MTPVQKEPAVRAGTLLVTTLLLLAVPVHALRSAARSRGAAALSMESMELQEAQFQILRVATAFSGWLLERKRLPEDLKELARDRSRNLLEVDLIDPGGTPLRSEITEPQPMWFRLIPAGPDRIFGTEPNFVHQVGGRK
jgi:hypothetical protein